jgi:hypothetical protein
MLSGSPLFKGKELVAMLLRDARYSRLTRPDFDTTNQMVNVAMVLGAPSVYDTWTLQAKECWY